MAFNLKRWAVRHISALLSDYLEGITEQNLQASLSLEVGQVDIRHVRVHPGLLAACGLQLLSSDVTISARIPWRTLGSERTVITVRDVWVEVRAEQSRACDDDPAALQRWRERKRRRVQQRVEAAREAAAAADAQAEDAASSSSASAPKRRSMATRLGHAALRQLQVRVEGLRLRMHPAADSGASSLLDVFCSRLALDEGGSAALPQNDSIRGSLPPEVDKRTASLDKVLELMGLSAQLQVFEGDREDARNVLALAEARYQELRDRLASQQKSLELSQDGDQAARCREVLEIREQLQAKRAGATLPVFGPLTLDSRLWHSADDGLLWLGVELQVGEDAVALRLSPIVAQYVNDCMAWYQSTMAPPRKVRHPRSEDAAGADVAAEATATEGNGTGPPRLSPVLSGHEYMELCMRRLRGEEVDEALLEDVEDVASVEWMVKYQLRCYELMGPSADPRRTAQKGKKPRVLGWLRKRWSGDGETEQPASEAKSRERTGEVDEFQDAEEDVDEDASAEGDDMEYLVEGADGLQEVEEPRRVMLRCMIRHCTIMDCQLEPQLRAAAPPEDMGEERSHYPGTSDSFRNTDTLRVEGGGECSVSLASASNVSLSSWREASWNANVSCNLSSVALMLGQEPLIILRRESDDEATMEDDFEECFEDEEQAQAAHHGSPVQLTVLCARNGGAAAITGGGQAAQHLPWSISVRLKQEPFRFLLAPLSVRRALEIAISVARPFRSGGGGGSSPGDAQANLPQVESFRCDADLLDRQEDSVGAGGSGNGVGESASQIALDLDLDVAAPVLRWGLLPEGHVTIAFGRLLMRTSGTSPPPARLAASERCAWQNFACYCQLTETSVAVVKGDGSQCWVYDPSTISLRAWRDGADGVQRCWHVDAKSEVVRWTVTPDVVKVAGQLPLSLDYALSPLRGLVAGAASSQESPPAGASAAQDKAVLPASETPGAGKPAPPQTSVLVRVSLRRCEIGISSLDSPRRVSVSFEGIQVEYEASAGRLDALGCVACCELAYSEASVVRCAKGGSFKVSNADHHIAMRGGSALIEVDWHEGRIRGIIAVFLGAWESWLLGRSSAKDFLAVGDSAGMAGQLWSRYVSRPLQDRVKRRAASRLADLLSGHGGVRATASDAGGAAVSVAHAAAGAADAATAESAAAAVACGEGVPADDSMEQSSEFQRDASGGSEGQWPPVDDGHVVPPARGKCSVEVHLAYEGVEFVLHQDEKPGTTSCQSTVKVAVKGAEGMFRGFRSGDATASISLVAAHLTLHGRRLLTPRRADKLLKVDILRIASSPPVFHWSATWAQVCMVFRQRDYDQLSLMVKTSVLSVLASLRKKDEDNIVRPDSGPQASGDSEALQTQSVERGKSASQRPVAPTESEAAVAPRAQPARFQLEIGAPCVFLPTDGSVLQKVGRNRSTGGSGEDQLEVDDVGGEPVFKPRHGEGFLVFDFGHVAASGGKEGTNPGITAMKLCGAHVLGAVPSQECVVQDVLRPVSFDAVLKTGDGPLEFHLTSLSSGDREDTACSPASSELRSGVDHHLIFTRGHLTLILDVLAENICYAGRSAMLVSRTASAVPPPAPAAPPMQPSKQQEAAPARRGGWRFSWSWPGKLVWDVGFTAAAPLVRFQLREGTFRIDNCPRKTNYELHCKGVSAMDMRVRTRNAVRSLLECVDQQDGDLTCFKVNVHMPADTDSVVEVRMTRPVWHVLPQLVMDLLTAGVSAWQQCTFRNDRLQLPQPVGPQQNGAADARCTRVELHLLDGTFRIAERWAEPSEHFEFAGSLLIFFVLHSEGTSIARFDLEGGSLRLCSSTRRNSTLCPCLEWMVRGEQRRTEDEAGMKRHTKLDFRSIIIPPYSIRMSAQDHRSMAGAVLELCSLDAESAEPPEELASRDPSALSLVENRITVTAEVAVQGAEVQVLGEERGHAWPGLRGHVRCPAFSTAIQIRPGVVPTINLHTKELEIELWAHNHRLGAWEPVVPACWWRVSYHTQRKPSGGPREVFVRSDAASVDPVRCVVSANFVHIAARVFRDGAADMRYGHLLAGLNISGVTCSIAVEGGGEAVLAAVPHVQPLDELLKSTGRGGQPSQPCLVLNVQGCGGGATCRVPLGREVCIPWDTRVAGLLVCRLIMPRPPQILLLVSSTVCIWNRTQTDMQVRFVAPTSHAQAADGRNPASKHSDLRPLMPGHACRATDARFLHSHGAASGAASASFDDASSASRPLPPPCGPDGALRFGAGQLLSAPPEAQLRVGQVVFQVRPAPEAAGNIVYEWSDPFFSVPEAVRSASGGVTVCSVPPEPALPRHWLHLYTASGNLEEGWCTVEVQAPFTLVNACPCDLLCRLNPQMSRTELGRDRSSVHMEKGAGLPIIIEDGRGGEVSVPPSCQCEVLPLQLDDDGYFYWSYNGRRSRVRPPHSCLRANGLIVFFSAQRGTIDWRYLFASMSLVPAPAPIRIAAQSAMPVFDTVAEDACVSFALRGGGNSTTSWSFPMQALSPLRSVHEVIVLEHRGMIVRLHACRRGRELVIYAKWWFVDSTGLGVQLLQPSGAGPMHPVPMFDGRIAFLPELRNEAGDGVAYMQLLGAGGAVVSARVPDVGGSEAVRLSPLHRCCLRTEAVALPEAMGVSCCLVSLLPALLLFNRAAFPVAFRQAGTSAGEALWLPSGGGGVLWWTAARHTSAGPAEQGLQVAARVEGSSTANAHGYPDRRPAVVTEWSQPFEIQEAMIGAYPLALKLGSQGRQLLCVCIDQDADVFSITARGPECCHCLFNKHRSVLLEASLEGSADDPSFVFSAPVEGRTSFGGRGPISSGGEAAAAAAAAGAAGAIVGASGSGPGRAKPRLTLKITNVSDPGEKAAVVVDLRRSGVYRVPLHPSMDLVARSAASSGSRRPARSTLKVPSVVCVQLRNRVAQVTVRPGRTPHGGPVESGVSAAGEDDGGDETPISSFTFSGELRVDSLLVALVADPTSPAVAGSSSGMGSAKCCGEAFTASLEGISIMVDQSPARRRDVSFQIRSAQLDMQHPSQDVVFKSTTRPFLKTVCQRDDVDMLDVHLRRVQLDLGEMEVSVTDAVWERVRLLRRSFAPDTGGVTIEEVVARAQSPYCREAPQASTRFIINRLEVCQAKVDVWCRIYLPDAHYVPKTLRDTLQVMSFGTNRLDVKGAQVRVAQQTVFSESSPGEGSLSAIVARVSDHYLPHLKASWRSLLQHSNIFFGGLFSRHTWMPRQRNKWAPASPLCEVGPGGELKLRETGQLRRGSSIIGSGGGSIGSSSVTPAAVAAGAAAGSRRATESAPLSRTRARPNAGRG